MARFVFAAFLVAAMFVSATPALSQQDLEQPSAPGGLGNTRSDLDLVYGAVERTNVSDLGDYAIASASYADEWVFYLIEDGTTPSPDDRAIIIHRYADVRLTAGTIPKRSRSRISFFPPTWCLRAICCHTNFHGPPSDLGPCSNTDRRFTANRSPASFPIRSSIARANPAPYGSS